MSRPILLLLACCGLAACSGEAPFVETFAVDIRKTSSLSVCHDQDATRAEIDAAANEGCARIDKVAKYVNEETMQCRLLAPHRAFYRCVAKPE
jgi:hypothetical protein